MSDRDLALRRARGVASRHRPEVIAVVDEMIEALDAATLGAVQRRKATSSFAFIVASWDRFRVLVDALETALTNPLDPAAAMVLKRAAELVDQDAYRLSFWLTHIAEATERYSPPRVSRRRPPGLSEARLRRRRAS
jgi:hypothetical protein